MFFIFLESIFDDFVVSHKTHNLSKTLSQKIGKVHLLSKFRWENKQKMLIGNFENSVRIENAF